MIGLGFGKCAAEAVAKACGQRWRRVSVNSSPSQLAMEKATRAAERSASSGV